MKNTFTRISLLLLLIGLLFSSKQSQASHIIGSEIFYSCTATPNVYLVTLKLYRDCNGIQMCANCPTSLSPSCAISLSISGAAGTCNGTNFSSQNLTVVVGSSGYDVVQLCNLTKTICSNCGSRTPGTFSPGVEIYTFQGNIVLSALPANCCSVRLSYTTCCRNNAITTLSNPSSLNFYSEAIINRCASPCNSSPVFNNPIDFVICSGKDQTINLGAVDPDGDSLSYAFGNSLIGAGQNAPYLSPYSATVPFPYLGAPVQSPPALPPTGIRLDKLTGDIQFRPQGSFVSNLVMEVKQWKRISNVPTLMGTTRRDFQIYSQNCPANSEVKLNKYDSAGTSLGTYGYYGDSIRICPGETFCRIFVASDTTKTDTTDLMWNNSNDMLGSTFTTLYNNQNRSTLGPRMDSVRFCWTVPADAGRVSPYLLTIFGQDRACSVPAKILRTIAFYVPQNPDATIIKTIITKNSRKLTYQNKNNAYINKALTQWQIETLPGSNTFNTTIADSILNQTFPVSGRYKIKLLLGGSCGTTTFNDSVDISFLTLSLVSSKNLVCKNDSSGEISVASTGGAGTMQYRANGGVWQTSGTFTKLIAGAYVIVAKDSFNTTDTLRLTLTQPSTGVTLSIASQVNLKCKGDSIGSVTLTAATGRLPYQYKILGGNYQLSNTIIGLNAGLKYFIVMDSLGCTATASTTITEPANKLTGNLVLTHPLCNGGSGSASISASGGISPYQYNVDGGSYNISNSFSSLSAKAYSFTIKDWNNCIIPLSGTVVEPTALQVNYVRKNISCKGANDGSVTFTITGATKPYRYKKGTGSFGSNNVFSALAAGSYDFVIADSNNCSTTINITITEPTTLTKIISGKNASCLGATNGSATILVNGGVQPYSYVWKTTPIQNTATASNLGAGYATVTVTDSNGCVVKDSVLIGYKTIYNNEVICAVSTDTATGNHLVTWNKTANVGTANYKILSASTASGPFTQLGTQPYNNYSVHTDMDASHLNKAWYYQIKAVDSCSNESTASGVHSNLYLSAAKSGTKNLLNWNPVMGPGNATGINVMRSINNSTFILIKQLPATAVNYTDSVVPAGNARYLLELVLSANCNPTLNKASVKIFSNIFDLNANGMGEISLHNSFDVYPNPTQGQLQIAAKINGLEIQSVEIINLLGEKVKGFTVNGHIQETSLDLADLPNGVYSVIVVSQRGDRYPTKVILSR